MSANNVKSINGTNEGTKPLTPAEALAQFKAMQEQMKAVAAQMAAFASANGIETTKRGLTDEQKSRIEGFQYEAFELDEQIRPLVESRAEVNVRYTAYLREIGHDPLCEICNGTSKTEAGETKLHKIVYSKSDELVAKFRDRLANRSKVATKQVASK